MNFLFVLSTSVLALVAAAALVALARRARDTSVLPRDFDFTRHKRFEPK